MDENLSLYYVFYVTAQKGNISQAAKELFISQPAISKSIRRLEENLHTVLFKRSSRGVALTEEGKLLFQHADQAFSALQSGRELLLHRQTLGISQLRIGVSSTLCKYVLLPYLQKFIRAHPHVRISIACQSTRQTIALLEENRIDIGLVGEAPLPKGFVFRPLMDIRDIFVTTDSYLEHLQQRSGSDDLYKTAVFMLLDEENISRQHINRVLEKQNIRLTHTLEVSAMDLLIEFAKIGMGVACVIREFVEKELEEGGLIPFPLDPGFLPRKIGFVFRKEEEKNAVIHHFLQI